MGISSYRDLKVWQLSMDIVEDVYQLKDFPKQETYGLMSQVQRAAVSVPSNIAEGHTRDSTKEFLHYLSIALGSLSELETQLMLSQRLRYISEQELNAIVSKTEETSQMLRCLQRSLKAKFNVSSHP